MRLQNKVALITGSGSGIGRAVAILFAKEGAKVAVNDANETGGKETMNLIQNEGGEVSFYKADVTKPAEIKSMVRDVISKYDRIDILHNNAGGWSREVSDTVTADSEEEWDKMVNLNLKAAYLVSREVIPHMIRHGGGSIINTITTNAFMNTEGMAAYGSAKAGTAMLTKAMALDYSKNNIRVNGIVPGEIRTPQWHATYNSMSNGEEVKKSILNRIPLGRFGEAEDIALGALFLASDDSRYVTGHMLFVDGGLTTGFYKYY